MDDGKRSYTAMFLPGEPARIFPTSNQEHARILQIYKQDRPYPDVVNDFTEYQIGQDGPVSPQQRAGTKRNKTKTASTASREQAARPETPAKKKPPAGKARKKSAT